MTTYAAIIVFIVFNSIGFIMLRKAMIVRRMSREATQWPTVNGQVVESKVIEEPARNAMGNVNNTYLIVAKYQYSVGGKQYEGERVAFGSPAFNYLTASNIKDQFAEGKEVPVYYNPSNPEECVLAPKTTVGMPSRIPGIFLLIIGVAIPLIAIFVK
jgi:hypothetical protein